ncbi:MAG: glycosyltransferase [Flavobacteriales bacterium]
MGTSIIIFSGSYPFEKGETFLANEVHVLSQEYDRVYVVCSARGSGQYWQVPDNAVVVRARDLKAGGAISYGQMWWLLVLDVISGQTPWASIRENTALLKDKFKLASKVAAFISSEQINDSIFYSYWFDDWATVLAILKDKGLVHSFISRVHRFDLFEELRPMARIPFRGFQLKHVTQVYSVSEVGTQYLKNKYPRYAHKFETAYLGTEDCGENPLDKEVFHVVSCSNLVPVKRVELIVSAVKKMQNVRWTHFGDGKLRPALEQMAQEAMQRNPSIHITFKGHVKNVDVMRYYEKNPVSVFINVSSSEGLPVSIMEAASFGIPIVATDVGGTREIVNKETGVLISSEPDVNEIIHALNQVRDEFDTPEKRNDVRRFWQNHFVAEKNYRSFVVELNQRSSHE